MKSPHTAFLERKIYDGVNQFARIRTHWYRISSNTYVRTHIIGSSADVNHLKLPIALLRKGWIKYLGPLGPITGGDKI